MPTTPAPTPSSAAPASSSRSTRTDGCLTRHNLLFLQLMAFDYARALDQLVAQKPGERALLLPHDNPDPDSMAAAMGLRKLLGSRGIACTIAQGGIIGRAENRAMV